MNREDIVERIRKYNIEEYKKIKENADLLIQDKIRFTDNWAMERCEDIVDFHDYDWDKIHNNDPEWTFMLNRQEYLKDLFIVYFIEDNLKYLKKMKDHIFSRIQDLEIMDNKKNSCRTLDTGIRISTWLFLLRNNMKYNFFTEYEEDSIKESILKQIDFLYKNFNYKYYLSNWGSLQIIPVLQFNSLFKGELDSKIIDFFECALRKNVELSINEDGTQWEQSIMYHVEVMISYLQLVLFDRDYLSYFDDKIYKMADYIYHATGPDNIQFAVGDSDFTDTRDVMTWMAMFFSDEKFKSKAFNHPDIISYFIFSCELILNYEEISTSEDLNFNKFYSDSGHVFLNDDNFHVLFKNGTIGSSHTHSDLNSIAFYYKGRPIVVDSGRYTYVDSVYRNFFKSSEAHSSIIIDDECPEVTNGSWDYKRYPETISLELNECEIGQYIESVVYGEISGKAYIHTRYLIKFKNKCLFIVDKVKMKGLHSAEIRFILDSNIENINLYGLKIIDNDKYNYLDTVISKKYNDISKTKMIVRKYEFLNNLYVSTIFCDENIDIQRIKINQSDKNEDLQSSFLWEIVDNDEKYFLNLNTEQVISGSKILINKENHILIRGKCAIIDSKKDKYYKM